MEEVLSIKNNDLPQVAVEPEVPFKDQPQVRLEPCSWNKCTNGHTWPVGLAVARCGGCGGLILAIKMEQCPICNEPTEKTKFRSDHLPQGAKVVASCRGEQSVAEQGDIELERRHYKEVELNDPNGDNHSRRVAGDLKGLSDGGELARGCEGGESDGQTERIGEVCLGGGESGMGGGAGGD